MVQETTGYPSKEYELLSELKTLLAGLPDDHYEIGIGDDAAVRPSRENEKLIFTTDIAVEHIDFKTEYMTFSEIGYKVMVANISDCAAMGAVPDSALVQVTFPTGAVDLKKSMEELYHGFTEACIRWKFPIVGGDLSSGPVWSIGITLIGKIPADARVLKRTGVKPGDNLWLTNTAGLSAAGLAVLQRWGRNGQEKQYAPLLTSHIAPTPRVEWGVALRENSHIHAMMDCSDGLSKDGRTLAYENGLGLLLFHDPSHIPVEMVQLSSELATPWENWYFHGGEEYELLFAADPSFDPSEIQGSEQFTRIGLFTNECTGVYVDRAGNRSLLEQRSFDHIH